MRAIDADALISKCDDRYTLGEIGRREHDDIVDALHFAPTLDVVERPRWIPLSEELPALEQDVLVITAAGVCVWSRLQRGSDSENWAWEDEYGYNPVKDEATHWMPIPQLPPEVQNG